MIYGIDLGTTNSCVAAWDDDFDKAQLLKNIMDGSVSTTPSVVFFDPKDAHSCPVGMTAVNLFKGSPKDVVRGVKRKMGDKDSYDPTKNLFPYGKDPEFISALILKKLVEDVQQGYNQEVKDVVITVPAYFGQLERRHTIMAGKLAGLNVKGIINEPTAAALAYGVYKKEQQTVLVFDLGGGTFDVTYVNIHKKDGKTIVQEIAKDGCEQLGGLDWDRALASEFLNAFNQSTGSCYRLVEQFSNNTDDEKVTAGLLQAAEEYKKMLSTKESIHWAFSYNGKSVDGEISRSTFDSLTKSLLDRTINMTRKVLDAAQKKNYGMPEKIILVGGSTRMKQIRDAIVNAFGKKPDFFEPDEAIALGAAVYAHDIDKFEEDYIVDKSAGTKTTRGALSKTYGIQTADGGISNIVFKNDTLPIHDVERERFITASDEQSSLDIQIFESDLDKSRENLRVDADEVEVKCKKIAESGITFNQAFPANTPITLVFSLDSEQLITIEAEIEGEKQMTEVNFDTVLSEEDMDRRKFEICGKKVN